MSEKPLCSIWTDVKIDDEKGMVFLKGNDLIRVDGSELLKILHEDKWREYKPVFENWKQYQEEVKNIEETKLGLLAWLNRHAYNRLHDELKKLEVSDDVGK